MPISDKNLLISGLTVFRFHDVNLRCLGLVPPANRRYRYLYYLYSLLLNTLVTIGYPAHLMIGLFQMEQKSDIFKNICVNFTVLACSIKTSILWWRLAEIERIYALIAKLDERITQPEDMQFYASNTLRRAKRVLNFLILVGVCAFVASEAATIFAGIIGEWHLMYPAYFPFDIEGHYVAAHLYQATGILLIFQNLTNDSFPAMALTILAGHTRLLGKRIARIGNTEGVEQLQRCIESYKDLLDFRIAIQSFISVTAFVQLLATGINMCVVIFYVLFYVNEILWFVYYMVYLVAMPLEIFPLCYYGTCMQLEFEQLTYAIFSCNWMDQSAVFKQNLRIFIEQTLRKQIVVTGGMFPVNLDTFFATLKGAYSLFAVVKQMK
ncbi:odorant receptor 59a-like [Bactrocera neohumeralis]|uniref:odorant receptor 59a-like n=1 Tax=Bactrocera neohumeralis TaxID=98809 RepID=UPI00216522CD|nr:odorant receptor 59a-like [Bactrocera neohumeralis]